MKSLASASERFADWIRTTSATDTVVPGLPAHAPAARRVHAYLLSIEGASEPNDPRRARRRHTLRYFVTASDPDPEGVRDVIGTLLVAASGVPDLECAAVRPEDALWFSLRLRPRPALRFGVPWIVERTLEFAPLVRGPLSVRFSSLRKLEGIVHGPDGTGIARATVRLPLLGRSTVTDDQGRFRIEGVATDSPLRLEIAARGHVAQVEAGPSEDTSLLHIRIDPRSS